MSEPSTTSRLQEAPAAEAAARMAPRRKTAEQRLRIQERLTMGLTVAHIAGGGADGATGAWGSSRRCSRRGTDPPAGFVQLQAARLSQAMIVARTMMMQGNLQAMDRWIELTGELDRYHGFSPAKFPGRGKRRRRAPRRAGAPLQSRPAEASPSPGSRRERA